MEAADLLNAIIDHKNKNPAIFCLDVGQIEDYFKVERKLAVEALKRLENEGHGTYISGRHGKKTRILFHRAVPTDQPEKTGAAANKHEGLDVQERVFKFREFQFSASRDIQIELPRDLTRMEAEKISQFILSCVSA